MPYLTLEQLKDSYLGTWDSSWDAWATRELDLVSSWLRTYFKNSGRDLDAEIADGEIELLTVESIVASMLIRKLTSSVNVPFGGEFSQLSQSAGGYSSSVTMKPSAASYYLRRDELSLLGFSNFSMASISIRLP